MRNKSRVKTRNVISSAQVVGAQLDGGHHQHQTEIADKQKKNGAHVITLSKGVRRAKTYRQDS